MSHGLPEDTHEYVPPPIDDSVPEASHLSAEQTTPGAREHVDEPNTKRKRGRPRKSDNASLLEVGEVVDTTAGSAISSAAKRKSQLAQDSTPTSHPSSSVKRRRTTMEEPSRLEVEDEADTFGEQTGLAHDADTAADSSDASSSRYRSRRSKRSKNPT